MNYSDLQQFAPDYWLKQESREKIQITRHGNEYEILNKIMKNRITTLVRYENVNRYVQFLVRQQLLLALEPNKIFYEVRRYVTMSDIHKDNALKYQLDDRRCNTSFKFNKEPDLNGGDVIFVVSVVTDAPNDPTFTQKRNSDFYIEYIINLE